MILRRGLSVLAAMAAVSALGACAISERDHVYSQAIGFQCANSSGLPARLACNKTDPEHGVERVSRYCYDTIGDANCFDRPDPDRKNQALGSSGY